VAVRVARTPASRGSFITQPARRLRFSKKAAACQQFVSLLFSAPVKLIVPLRTDNDEVG